MHMALDGRGYEVGELNAPRALLGTQREMSKRSIYGLYHFHHYVAQAKVTNMDSRLIQKASHRLNIYASIRPPSRMRRTHPSPSCHSKIYSYEQPQHKRYCLEQLSASCLVDGLQWGWEVELAFVWASTVQKTTDSDGQQRQRRSR